MFDLILIRYGELSVKGRNRPDFIFQLVKNISHQCRQAGFKLSISHTQAHIYIDLTTVKPADYDQLSQVLTRVFGISSFSFVKKTDLNWDNIKTAAFELLDYYQPQSFKLKTKRANKGFFLTSPEVNRRLGDEIVQAWPAIKVDLEVPELTLVLEIRNHHAYLSGKVIAGLGGFPVGINGKVLLLISGGIDSPVASFLLMKRGLHVDYLHFATPPTTPPATVDKVRTLIRTLQAYSDQPSQLNVCNFTPLQAELTHLRWDSYRVLIMRRMFYRIASALVKQNHYGAFATGEALNQVASQTLANLQATAIVTSTLVLRPLLTYDKIEIIGLAEQINTYQTSILPVPDCCSLFVPKSPVITGKIEACNQLEQELLWKELFELVLTNHITTETIGE